MSENLFLTTLERKNEFRPPVWFMRQAGRYHSHYQNLRQKHSFIELCKNPALACEVTMGPIEDFDFDAAILFSDLLFPLESMGMGLEYSPGPKLSFHLERYDDLKKMKAGKIDHLSFQAEALRQIKKKLPQSKGLLGFVGGPWTLFVYASDGSHKGELPHSKAGLLDGRFDSFCELLIPLLVDNIALQLEAGADLVAILDTSAGVLDAESYRLKVIPVLGHLMNEVKKKKPKAKLGYYSKETSPQYWSSLKDLPFEYFGADWNHDLSQTLVEYGDRWAIQGNVDPNWLLLPEKEMETQLRVYFSKILKVPQRYRTGWICGLGHGILPKTPEKNVRKFLKVQKEMFG